VSRRRDFSSASRTFFGIECGEQELTELDGAFAEAAFRAVDAFDQQSRGATIWKACADGLWRLFLHLIDVQEPQRFAGSL